MRIKRVTLHEIRIPLIDPFVAAHGTEIDKQAILVEVETDAGARGIAECVAGGSPHYTEETTVTAWHVLREWLVPSCLGITIASVQDIARWFDSTAHIRGHRMAKAGLEMALWDAFAAQTQTPLASLLGGSKTEVPVGISIGLQPSIQDLIAKVGSYLGQGFQRIKLKVEPGRDEAWVSAVRGSFPEAAIMVDANSAYADMPATALRWLDQYGLTMVEQPLGYDDLIDHAELQRELNTPICLDESIRSVADVRRAARIGAGRIINVKAGRVGGITEVLRIHAASRDCGVALWCGGMLETGVGRLHNIALSALSSFTHPGDTAPSARYFVEDIVDPPITFARPGWLAVEPICGVSARLRRDRLEKWTERREAFQC